MNIELQTFEKLSSNLQQQIAWEASCETNNKFMAEQKIVPVGPDTILQRQIGLVALHNKAFAGYVSAQKLNNKYTQISTLLVPEQYQGSGIGNLLVSNITESILAIGYRPFAFCNTDSLSSFEKNNYLPIPLDELPVNTRSRFSNQTMIHVC